MSKKIDAAQIKQVLSKLEFLRSYTAYLLPLIIFLIALVILFGVRPLMSSNLKKSIRNQSVKNAKAIQRLQSQEISRDQWKEEKKYQDALAADVNHISKMSMQTTQRELLQYGLFPESKDKSISVYWGFGQAYRQSIENLMTQHKARQCPSRQEIEIAVTRTSSMTETIGMELSSSKRARKTSRRASDQGDEVEQAIIDEICLEAARSASFYADPLDIAGYLYWAKPEHSQQSSSKVFEYVDEQDALKNCWFWQIGYWMIEDVFSSISAMNKSCKNVLDCPVKHLVFIDFSPEITKNQKGAQGEAESPFYLMDPNISAVTESVTSAHTKRLSNEDWDVTRFRFAVVINAKSVQKFMNQVCSPKKHKFKGWQGADPEQTFQHNQITIVEAFTVALSGSSKADSKEDIEFYRYGDDAVVELELVCEYIFSRRAYEDIKPVPVKDLESSQDDFDEYYDEGG